MKKNKITLIFCLLLVTPTFHILTTCSASQNQNDIQKYTEIHYYKNGYRYNIQGWVYMHLEGEPYDRGYQYGYLASEEIIDLFYRYAEIALELTTMKKYIFKTNEELSERWWNTVRTKSMKYFHKHVPEEYKQELKGITDGLNAKNKKIFGRGVEYEDVVASQFFQEVKYGFFDYPQKRFHPFMDFIYGLRDLFTKRIKNGEIGHCHAFISTGDATEDGDIVAGHATVFPKYISQRCNFIVNIKPTDGFEFTMTGPPGSLWSQEDWYQNEKGIILTETELTPQGPFNIKKTPKGIRSRQAIQYSENIDEVISNLQKNNNGLIPNEWLIGDAKNGEIAKIEQAYYNSPIQRTKNGFFESLTYPHNEKVRKELFGRGLFHLYNIATKTNFGRKILNKYDGRLEILDKFQELKKKYYGKINEEVAKEIFSTSPINRGVSDCKITSSKMLKNKGLIAFMGNPIGLELTFTDKQKAKHKSLTNLPASGWLEIYTGNTGPKNQEKQSNKKIPNLKNISKGIVLWDYKQEGFNNDTITELSSDLKSTVFTTYNNGKTTALNKINREKIWERKIKKKIFQTSAQDELLLLATYGGLYGLNAKTGVILWCILENTKICSISNINNGYIYAGSLDGVLYAIDISNQRVKWSYKLEEPVRISNIGEDKIFVNSGKKCIAFNLNDGHKIWEFKTQGINVNSPLYMRGRVYFGSWDKNIYCLKSENGELLWSYSTGWGIETTPCISEDMIYFGGLDGVFYALDKNTGELKWEHVCNSAIHSKPNVYGECVFFGSDDGRFYSIDKKNGKVIWTFEPEYYIDHSEVNNYITTPILSDPYIDEDGVIYINVRDMVYALDSQTFETSSSKNKAKTDLFEYESIIILSIIVTLSVVILISFLILNNKNK